MCAICFSSLGFHVAVCGIFGAICAISPVPFFSSHILNHCHSRSRSLRSITMKQFDISTIIASFHSLLLSVYVAIATLQLQPIDVNAMRKERLIEERRKMGTGGGGHPIKDFDPNHTEESI